MENNSTSAPNMQALQLPLNTANIEKLIAFARQQNYVMRQLRILFDILVQSQDMEIDINSLASIGWDITNESVSNSLDVETTALSALKAAKGGQLI